MGDCQCDQIGRKFANLAKIQKSLATFERCIWYLAKLRIPFGTFYAFGQNFIVVNGRILKNNLAIWSHWRLPYSQTNLGTLFFDGDVKCPFEWCMEHFSRRRWTTTLAPLLSYSVHEGKHFLFQLWVDYFLSWFTTGPARLFISCY